MKIIFYKTLLPLFILSALATDALAGGKYDFPNPYAGMDMGQMDSAIHILSSGHFKNASNTNTVRQLAEAYTASDNTDSALFYWGLYYTAHPDCDTALYLEGQLYYQSGQYNKAAEALRSATTIVPGHLSYLYLLALADYRLHQPDTALAVCGQVLSQSPDDADALLLSGIILRDQRKNKEALERFDRCLKADPANTEALLHRADEYVLLGKYHDALRDYSAARADLSDNPDILNNIGICYYQSGAYAQAITIFKKALALDHRHPQSYFNKGLAYYYLHSLDTASADMKAAGAIWDTAHADTAHASYLDAVYYLALCYKETGDLPAARSRFLLLQKENYPKDIRSELRDINYAIFISENWYYFLLLLVVFIGLGIALYKMIKR